MVESHPPAVLTGRAKIERRIRRPGAKGAVALPRRNKERIRETKRRIAPEKRPLRAGASRKNLPPRNPAIRQVP